MIHKLTTNYLDNPYYNSSSYVELQYNQFRYGYYGLVSPTTLYYEGKTFTTSMTPYTFDNNQAYIIEIENDVATYKAVGTGTAIADLFNHPTPMLHIDDSGYIWVFQTDPHDDPINVFKSNAIGTISSGFTSQGQININSSYMNIFYSSDRVLKIMTRPNATMGHQVIDVDLDNLAGATIYDITDPDYAGTNVRHYFYAIRKHGTSTKEWAVILHRTDTGNKVYKTSAYYWLKSNEDVIYNLDGSYSNNINTAAITDSELEDNGFIIQGTDNDKTIADLGSFACQVDNDLYVSQRVAPNEWRIMRIDASNNKTYSIIWSNPDDAQGKPFVMYNGTNLVIQRQIGTTIYIYAASLDLSVIEEVTQITSPDSRILDFPVNFEDVTGEYAIILGDEGTIQKDVEWITTNDKFIL